VFIMPESAFMMTGIGVQHRSESVFTFVRNRRSGWAGIRNQRQPEEAVKQYVGSSYRQHNPMAGDGPEPFIGFVKWITGENPDLRVEFKRFIAESDLVAVHSHLIPAKGVRGTAVIDIFRLENGKIVEH
jgi:predicted SnoaL-like aldol condensation-catalyzing enzyme